MNEQQLISQLLGDLADSLDVPADLQRAAAVEYNDLGSFLKERDHEDGRRDPDIFPQGSSSTGTVVRPITRKDDFDVDLVYLRPLQRESITQEQLKEEAHSRLQAYLTDLERRKKEVPKMETKGRCLALVYPRWHMDVVPMIPEELSSTTNSKLLITDRKERAWLVTDPKGYRDWFLRKSDFTKLREGIAMKAGRPVEQIPAWEVKSSLQRAVQVLKRHRDWHFRLTEDKKPASIVLTTIAANNYGGQNEIADALVAFCRGARNLEREGGVRWVRNPTIREENFIEKWKDDATLETEFDKWVDKLERDLVALGKARGLQNVGIHMQEMVGDVAKSVLEKFGGTMRTEREEGRLRVSSMGVLGATGVAAVAPHTFYGGA
ncbi:MAG: nucleotidyltransferase [Planctomycetota bacterium]|nr:nucleotidyltransferase [Planctomycetota bacterium]